MDNLNEKSIDLLRSKLVVYEAEGIECQLQFEKKKKVILPVNIERHPLIDEITLG